MGIINRLWVLSKGVSLYTFQEINPYQGDLQEGLPVFGNRYSPDLAPQGQYGEY